MSDGSCTGQVRPAEEELGKSISEMFTGSGAIGRSVSGKCPHHCKVHNLWQRTQRSCKWREKSLVWQLPSKFPLSFICCASQLEVYFPAEVCDFLISFTNTRWKVIEENQQSVQSALSEKFSSGSTIILTCQIMQTYWSMGRAHQQWPSWFEGYN